ncbi:MAG: DnaB-like helicase C-terminal domain-containing protein, partial [Lachnospiraceae bacterium]|nr:DnaB-like helicase C-terminal domain-containing protein [Lachnospiraceae bacterium]
LAMRILSTESRLSSEKLRSGRVNDPDMQNLMTTAGMIAEEKGYIIVDDSSNITISELRSKCRKIKKEQGLDAVFIDYLQLMHAGNVTSDSSFAKFINNRQEEVAEISRSLKGLAKELNIPIIALAQTRRPSDTSEKKDKRPQLEDLKESGAIEQDADIVMFLHRPHKDDPEVGNIEEMQLIIAKHRNGSTGTISFRFDKSITRFDEFDKNEDRNVRPPETSKKEEATEEAE